jgi:diphthamide synthase (EF-2-diphthine--ammonia ligase)
MKIGKIKFQEAKLEITLPLWQQDRLTLVSEMIDNGIETMIVSCNIET